MGIIGPTHVALLTTLICVAIAPVTVHSRVYQHNVERAEMAAMERGLVEAEIESLEEEVQAVKEEMKEEAMAEMQPVTAEHKCASHWYWIKYDEKKYKNPWLQPTFYDDYKRYLPAWYDEETKKGQQRCSSKKGATLTLSELREIADNMFHGKKLTVFRTSYENGRTPSIAYVTPTEENTDSKCVAKLYRSGKHECDYKKANNKWKACKWASKGENGWDSEMRLLGECPKVKEYWSVWTPCRYCVRSLIKFASENGPVTIHFGHWYVGKKIPGEKQKDLDKHYSACLALLLKEDKLIKLVLWNWDMFATQNKINRPVCQKTIKLISKCREFEWEKNVLKKKVAAAWGRVKENTKTLEDECYSGYGIQHCASRWDSTDKSYTKSPQLEAPFFHKFKRYLPAWYDKETNYEMGHQLCSSKDGATLTLSELREIADNMIHGKATVFRTSYPYGKTSTIAYVTPTKENTENNCDAKLYRSGTCENDKKKKGCDWASKGDSEMQLLGDCPKVKEFWSVSTPCRYCVKKLIDFAKKNGRVTIHFGHWYLGKPLQGEKNADKHYSACLALLIKETENSAIKIRYWSWNSFATQNEIDNPVCLETIKLIYKCKEFQLEKGALKQAVINARKRIDENTETLEKECYSGSE